MKIINKHIRKLLIFALLALTTHSFAQVIDTVCASYPYGRYGVHGNQNSSYFWDVTGGQIIQSNGKDSIKVKWNFANPQFNITMVEVSAGGCHGDTVYAEIYKGMEPVIYIAGSDSLCIGGYASLSGQGGIEYYWSTGDTTNNINPIIISDTTFVLIGTDGCGFDTTSINITALDNPSGDFIIQPKEVIENEESQFKYTGTGGVYFEWLVETSLLNDNSSIVNYSFQSSGNHKVSLYVENQYQCSDTSSQNIFVNKSRTNSFTPNGDGVNDKWLLEELSNFPNFKLWIFDRNGGEVFFSEAVYEPWDGTFDGKDLPQGTYYYVLDYGIDNRTGKGTVTILR